MGPLVVMVIFGWLIVIAIKFIPWMLWFREGLPGLYLYAMQVGSVVVPFVSLILLIDWGKHAIWKTNVYPEPAAWAIALVIMAASNTAVYFVLCMVEQVANDRFCREADMAEKAIRAKEEEG